MIVSMTGFGDARHEDDRFRVAAEIRTVNNRYLKVQVRCADLPMAIEAEVEKLVRRYLSRGTANVVLRIDRVRDAGRYQLDEEVIGRYLEQVGQLAGRHGLGESVGIKDLLPLPGVVVENDSESVFSEEQTEAVRRTVVEALERLNGMRAEEGRHMAEELAAHCDVVAERTAAIADRVPQTVAGYRDKIHERVRNLLTELDVEIDQADLIREVSIFADRSDITEELCRLRSHVDQFREALQLKEAAGRRLDFVTQEMFREANTVGAKCSDVAVSREVVELKETIGKMREQVQNVE